MLYLQQQHFNLREKNKQLQSEQKSSSTEEEEQHKGIIINTTQTNHLKPHHIDPTQNKSNTDSSNAYNHYVPPITSTIKQLSGGTDKATEKRTTPQQITTTSGNSSDVDWLIKLCAEYSVTKGHGTKSVSSIGNKSVTQSVFSAVASSTINNTLNALYDMDDTYGIWQENSSKSSKTRKASEQEEAKIEDTWNHYMKFHKGTQRKNKCSKGDKCLWVQHMNTYNNRDTNNSQTINNLLAFCSGRKQLYHVYFYHADDYDRIKGNKARHDRFIESSEDAKEISMSIPNGMGMGTPHHEQENTESHIPYQVSQLMPYITKDESNVSMSRLKNVPNHYEPGTPFNDNPTVGAYDILNGNAAGIDLNENGSVINIEMTQMNNDCVYDDDIDDGECLRLRKLLDYGSAENCNLPDTNTQHFAADGPEEKGIESDSKEHKSKSRSTTKGKLSYDDVNVEEENNIKEFLHCFTLHSESKREICNGQKCRYKEWRNNPQQTMRQMIHSEFYQHEDMIEIVIQEPSFQRTITMDANDEKQNKGEKNMTPIPEEDTEFPEESKDDEKSDTSLNPLKSSLLKPIVYIPTVLEILKSKTQSIDPDAGNHAKILQFGHPFTEKQPQFKNPKMEILHNDFKKITVKDWNDVLKKCVGLHKSLKAKSIKLSIKQLVALKLYTDLLSASTFCLSQLFYVFVLSINTGPIYTFSVVSRAKHLDHFNVY